MQVQAVETSTPLPPIAVPPLIGAMVLPVALAVLVTVLVLRRQRAKPKPTRR